MKAFLLHDTLLRPPEKKKAHAAAAAPLAGPADRRHSFWRKQERGAAAARAHRESSLIVERAWRGQGVGILCAPWELTDARVAMRLAKSYTPLQGWVRAVCVVAGLPARIYAVLRPAGRVLRPPTR